LQELYEKRGLSAHEIAVQLGVSDHKVNYWMDQHGIRRRHWSDASYIKHNPNGEKFRIDLSNRELFVAGVALYLGEGDKTNSGLILTNSDPGVVKLWGRFLEEVCHVSPEKLKARIDYYEDLDYSSLLTFWSQELGIPIRNFNRPTIKKGRAAKEIYRGRRSTYGTIHVYFNDSRLKSLMVQWMQDLIEGRL